MNLQSKRIFITGSSGFLGQYLTDSFSKGDCIVYAMTSKPIYNMLNTDKLIHVPNIDLVDFDFSKIDVLINCAFSRDDNGKNLASALKFNQNVFFKATRENVGAIINISSQSVYSTNRNHLPNEKDDLSLDSKYALGKYSSELLLGSLCQINNIPYTNLRLASLIGRTFNQRLFNQIFIKLLKRENITFQQGNQLFEYLDIRDAASAIKSLVSIDYNSWNSIYNLGSGEQHNMSDIIKIMEPYIKENNLSYKIRQIDNSSNNAIDSSLFHEQCNWKPKYCLNESVKWIYEGLKLEND